MKINGANMIKYGTSFKILEKNHHGSQEAWATLGFLSFHQFGHVNINLTTADSRKGCGH